LPACFPPPTITDELKIQMDKNEKGKNSHQIISSGCITIFIAASTKRGSKKKMFPNNFAMHTVFNNEQHRKNIRQDDRKMCILTIFRDAKTQNTNQTRKKYVCLYVCVCCICFVGANRKTKSKLIRICFTNGQKLFSTEL
jgi:hypothetical protein